MTNASAGKTFINCSLIRKGESDTDFDYKKIADKIASIFMLTGK